MVISTRTRRLPGRPAGDGRGSRAGRTALLGRSATVVGAVAALTVALASPAGAVAVPNGQNGSTAPISGVAIVLLFIGIPLAVLALAAIVVLPARAVGALRYRPGRQWGYDREWFGTRPERVVGDLPETGAGASELFQAGGARADW